MPRDLTASAFCHKTDSRGAGLCGWLALLAALASLTACPGGEARAEPHAAQEDGAGDGDVFFSPEACERAAPVARAGVRVMSLNVRWFPDGHARPGDDSGTDVDWLACALAKSSVDIVALQEVKQDLRGRRALADLLDRVERQAGVRYEARFDDCPDDGRQHVGFLYDPARVHVDAVRQLDDVNPHGGCRLHLRPGLLLRAHVGGQALSVVTVHLDSGVSSRDRGNRGRSVARLRAWLDTQRDGGAALLIGDFNTMGCSRCEPAESAEEELIAFDRALPGRLPLSEAAACSEYHRGRAGLLDHAVFAPGRSGWRAAAAVAGPCAERRCGRPRRGSPYLRRISDHCPLIVELSGARRATARGR